MEQPPNPAIFFEHFQKIQQLQNGICANQIAKK